MNVTLPAIKLRRGTGGSSYSLDLLARQLENRGHDVTILTLRPSTNELFPDRSYSVLEFPKRFDSNNYYYRYRRTYQILEQTADRTDLFHLFSPSLIPVGINFRKEHSTPIIARLNSYPFCTNRALMDGDCHQSCTVWKKYRHDTRKVRHVRWPRYRYFTDYWEQADVIDHCFAVSPAVKEIYSDVGVPDDVISVVPNFYDAVFGSSIDVQTNKQVDRLLYVGRLRANKGVDLLLRAVSLLADDYHIRLSIVGDGREQDELQKLAKKLGISNIVTFHGYVPHEDLPEFYQNNDIFVHPGRWPEPLSRTTLESMQYKCVPVVSDIGGTPWAIGDAGLTFSRNDVQELEKQLRRLMSDPNLYQTKQSLCQDELKRFAPKRVVDKIEGYYTSAVKSNQ